MSARWNTSQSHSDNLDAPLKRNMTLFIYFFRFLKTVKKREAGDVRSLKAADTLLAPSWFSSSLASPSHLYVWDHQALVSLPVVLPVVLVHFVHFHSDKVDKPELPVTRLHTERYTPTWNYSDSDWYYKLLMLSQK